MNHACLSFRDQVLLRLIQVNTVSEDRGWAEEVESVQPLNETETVLSDALRLVLRSLSNVDVYPHSIWETRCDPFEGLVREGERGVETEEPSARMRISILLGDETEVLLDPCRSDLFSVPIGDLVAEHTAQTDPLADLLA
jgi:hypothetical protein